MEDCLVKELHSLESFKKAKETYMRKKFPLSLSGLLDSSKCHFMHALSNNNKKLIITYSEKRAKEIIEDYQFFDSPNIDIVYYPVKDIIFYSADVHSNDIVNQRLKIINKLLDNKPVIVVTSVEALLDPVMSKETFKSNKLYYELGDIIDINKLSKHLTYMGYERTEQVESTGQFSVRGGIIDIYSIHHTNIYRVELWGDEIDSIREVSPDSQRSIKNIDDFSVIPAREFVINDEAVKRAISKIKIDFNNLIEKFQKAGKFKEAEQLEKTTSSLLNKVENNGNFNGIESNIKYYFEDIDSIIDYFNDADIFLDEPVRIKERCNKVKDEFNISIKNRFEKGYILPGQLNILHDIYEIFKKLQHNNLILLSSLFGENDFIQSKEHIDFTIKSINPYHNNFEVLKKDLTYWINNNYKIVLLSASKTRAERMVQLLEENNISAYHISNFNIDLVRGKVGVANGSLHKGFEYTDIKFVLITETEVTGNKKKKRRRRTNKSGHQIKSFTDLKVGDYVVHENYGVGIFKGIEKIEVEGIIKDFIKISYKDDGNLYINTNQLDVIQKYIGAEGKRPKLNKLGTNDWQRTKAKVKMAVEDLAKELVELYAKREVGQGFSYSKDSLWQKEFEELFPYEETEDQLNAIEETKRDMESSKIMDRLICGDVGYGKTEIAIRAAFKAVQDNKQVAYLVPTTILAQQQYNNFVKRMKDFPVRIEVLSRFRTQKEQKNILNDLKKGMVDIIIGTHRLISKDVIFKDLGLLIVDEEQRFGVAHKEKIKKVKENIDVLTLTATPIPRTLHMSLIGIRDMSILEEPPQERHPIQTYVLEYNEELIKDAIYRELNRGGQVYYVYNRVKNIDKISANISKLIPEATVAYAHGQMSERELENIMLDFINGDIDILVCTTIIETGLDIQNANTIIVHDADKMGLSQLYQLRGRVGRSNRVAYAYLTYKKDKVLQEVAEKRLQAIKQFTEFGSGFKIAMRDLEIRGAGNILGAKQHGHMDAVGYELYCKLLEEAVSNIKYSDNKEKFETTVNLDIDAYIPDSYIKDEIQKIEAYKKISSIENEEDYLDVRDELIDRYGDIPKVVTNLLEIALIKSKANEAEITAIKQNDSQSFVLEIKNDANFKAINIPDLLDSYKDRLKFSLKDTPVFLFSANKKDKQSIFEQIIDLLKKIKELKH